MAQFKTKSWMLKVAAITLLIPIFAGSAVPQTKGAEANLRPAATMAAHPHRTILVSIPDRKLAVIESGAKSSAVLRIFPVSVGTLRSPSPTRQFEIVNRLTNPTYYRKGVVIGPGAGNPIGTRWLGLDRKGYGIHGTNEPRSIGKAASHGCIRLRNRDMEQLFTMVHTGDTVEIRSGKDKQIAQIFGGPPDERATNIAQAREITGSAGGQ